MNAPSTGSPGAPAAIAPRRRVLFLCRQSGLFGGGQRSLLLLLRHLDRTRFEAVLAVSGRRELAEEASALGVPVVDLPLSAMRGFRILRLPRNAARLARFCRSERIDLLVAMRPALCLCALSARLLGGPPWVWNVRTSQDQGRIGRFLSRFASRVLLVADALRMRFPAIEGTARLAAIPNGVDPRDFEGPGRAESRSALGIPAEGAVAVVVGRVERDKGGDLAVEALSGLPGLRLAFAGREAEPLFAESLRSRSAALGFADRIHFLGEIPDLTRRLAAFDLLVHPSRHEAFPRAVLEGMAAGLPVVATDVGGTREALDEACGILVPPEDPAALREAIRRVLSDPDAARGMGEAGRARAFGTFDAARVARRYGRLFSEALGDSDPEARPCPLCGSREARALESDPPFWTVRCIACGLVYVDPVPEPDPVKAHYDDEGYYAEWVSTQAAARSRLWDRRLGRVRRVLVAGRLLDVGCADGAFLEKAKTAGFEAVGTEISAAAARLARARGLEVREGTLESAAFPDASFDGVSMWHVLEHVPDPVGTLKEIRRILKPGGRLFLAVPNLENAWFKFFYRLFRRRPERLFARGMKEWHLFHFTASTLSRALSAAGLEVEASGLDEPDADVRKRALEWPARAWFGITGRNRTIGIQVRARRPAS